MDQPGLIRTTRLDAVVPFKVREQFQVKKQLAQLVPWFPPACQGLQGTRTATGEPLVMISGEMPIHLFPWRESVEKEELEALHVEKFCTDFCFATGERPYTQLHRGDEPPDFVGSTPQGTRRIDCTQFIIGSRRAAHAMFRAVRKTIVNAGPDRFHHLHGLLIWVWADTKRARLDLPLRASAQQELLEALEQFHFKPEYGRSLGPGIPQVAPDFGMQTSASGWRFYATPLMTSVPSSPFFIKMGFEIAFNYPTEHTPADLWNEFVRVIVQHDQPVVDDLIVTVGGPDREGYNYLGEDLLFEFMLTEMPLPALSLQYTKRVLVHRWDTGSIIQFHPTLETITDGLYQSSAPAHQPLVPR